MSPIVILGATSQIGRDFVLHAHRVHGADFALFARRPEAVRAFLSANGLPLSWSAGTLDDLATRDLGDVQGVVNCVGVGDPAKAKEMGADIFAATRTSDAAASAFLKHHQAARHVFLSSGAVYGSGFDQPADASTPLLAPVAGSDPQHWYGAAKSEAEAAHRATPNMTILDLRVFNYVSRTQDIATRFLVTDMLRCVAEGRTFETTDAHMRRDYIHPEDLTALILALLGAPPGANMPVDAYSRAPVSKAELIDLFIREFGLKVRIVSAADTVNATGAKPEYWSRNRAAEQFGYAPRFSSEEAVLSEATAMLERLRR